MNSQDWPEARAWLNDAKKMIAGNRFNRDELVRFIDELYWAGAIGVVVQAETADKYADTLIVKMPEDPLQRERLFAIYHQESETCGEGFGGELGEYDVITREVAHELGDPSLEGEWIFIDEPLKDKGQATLTFWWD